jgi:glycosyltransferase involved in cell wall biosynthesis
VLASIVSVYFDVETFGKGYGEENDFCQRALGVGWRSCFTLDTFVYHTGNVSFGDEHNDLKHAAMGKLLVRHPPPTSSRYTSTFCRILPAPTESESGWPACVTAPLPLVVHVAHNRGGGTARFVEELSDELSGQASSLILMPSGTKPGYLVLARVQTHAAALPPDEPAYGLYFHAAEEQKALVKLLASLPISNFHFHHLVGLPDWVQQLPRQLSLPWYVSFHDYYMACPQISLTDHYGKYCEEKGISACNACLKLNPAPNQADIESWRDSFRRLIDEATICFAPSIDCQTRMEGYFPDANIVTAYHQQSRHIAAAETDTKINDSGSASRGGSENNDRPLKVLVLGALSQIKGADTLEALAVHSQKAGLPIDFTLLGYAYRTLITRPHSRLHVGGAYQESQLAGMLEEKKRNGEADLVWFTALWPETFSYTLSAAIEAGLPILAPNIGAFSERLYRRPYSWVLPWNASMTTIADLLMRIRGVMLQGKPATELATFESVAPFASNQYLYAANYLNGMLLPELSRFPDHSALPSASRKATLQWVAAFTSHFQPNQTWKERFRYQMLWYLVRLRGMPIMRAVVRKIPPGIQRRIKDRLLK